MNKRTSRPAVVLPGLLLAGLLLLACAMPAHAQWEWKDADNVRHFSDQPPPASVPPSRILKAPRGQMPDLRKELAEQPATAPTPVLAPAPAPAAVRPSVAERNATATQRREETVERARMAAQEAQNKAANAAACDNARSNLRVLESGMRIATTDSNGAPAYLDDTQKAVQMQRNRDMLATHCRQ
jgi:hypothetical protein